MVKNNNRKQIAAKQDFPHAIHIYNTKKGITRSLEFEKKRLVRFAINVGTKCENDCLYCSTGAMLRMHSSFRQFKRDPFGFGYAIVDPDKPEKVSTNAKNMRKRGLIQLCTVTDAWCSSARRNQLGRKCLQAILNEPGWEVRILTKNHEVEDDFDLIQKHRERVLVGLSITTTPGKQNIMQVIEKNASPIRERMRVMKKAHQLGLRTYAMFCPLLPGIADTPEQIDSYIQFAESIGVEEVFCEAVNPRGKGLIHTQAALETSGFIKEAQAIEAVRHKKGWSDYAYNLIKNVQISMRKYSTIKKLRFLLYPKNLLSEHVKKLNNDDTGIIWL
jgi:DNA repair photolyase